MIQILAAPAPNRFNSQLHSIEGCVSPNTFNVLLHCTQQRYDCNQPIRFPVHSTKMLLYPAYLRLSCTQPKTELLMSCRIQQRYVRTNFYTCQYRKSSTRNTRQTIFLVFGLIFVRAREWFPLAWAHPLWKFSLQAAKRASHRAKFSDQTEEAHSYQRKSISSSQSQPYTRQYRILENTCSKRALEPVSKTPSERQPPNLHLWMWAHR